MGSQTPQTRSALKTGGISITKPDVISLLHEVVISLCQRKYSSLPGVEVDGIICISFSGTSEQQVVKIHETLNCDTSEFGTAANKPDSSKSDTYELDVYKPDTTDTHESPSQVDFQREINNLSDLLKSSNEMCARNIQSLSDVKKHPVLEPHEKGRKRKRKPVHNSKAGIANENVSAKENDANTLSLHTPVNDVNTVPTKSDIYNEALADVSDSNLIIVKEEVQDDEYYSASCPKIVSVFSQKDKQESVSSTKKLGQVDNTSTSKVTGHVSSSADPATDKCDNNVSPSHSEECSFPVQVKMEKDDCDYEAAYGIANSLYHHDGNSDMNHNTSHQQNVFPNSEVQSNSHCEHSDGACSKDSDTGDVSDLIMARYMANELDDELDDEPEIKKKRIRRKQSDGGKLWNEMITTNVSRYQAALMCGKLKPTGQEPNPVVQSQVRDMLDGKSMVTNYIKSGETDFDKGTPDTASVKIESMCDDENEYSSQCEDMDMSRERSASRPRSTQGDEAASTLSNCDKEKDYVEIADEPQGELGQRYPSLFNQLQMVKATSSATEAANQPESLVNRLPYISFQELFAGASNDTKNESQVAGLLASPSPERTGTKPTPPVVTSPSKVKKKRWNWKKRVVRPRGPDGEILSQDKYTLVTPPLTGKSNKTKSKATSDDQEWHPSQEDRYVAAKQKIVTPVVSTRLSSGEKERKSFVEIESDFDVDTPDEDGVQFVSAYCRKGCGAKFTSIEARDVHGDTCGGPRKDFKCDICGLDFNQQYRWQYHMIKVHGITPNSSMLFR